MGHKYGLFNDLWREIQFDLFLCTMFIFMGMFRCPPLAWLCVSLLGRPDGSPLPPSIQPGSLSKPAFCLLLLETGQPLGR